MKEIGWFVGSTKSSQRKYAASKLISRLTGSARLLAMSWSQREFEGERGVALLLQRLSASPLVRRSLPNAAAIMSEYFGFKRRPQEHIGAFLVRETLGFEEFSEALLQLKAERDGLDPASRNFDLPEISPDTDDEDKYWRYRGDWRDWTGWHDNTGDDNKSNDADDVPDREGYEPVPQQSDHGSERPAESPVRSPARGSPSRRTTVRPVSEHPELSSMDSFILDVLRGWRLLVAASLSPDEWRDVLATTGNKLDYLSISNALQTLWDDQLGGGNKWHGATSQSSMSSFWHESTWPTDYEYDGFWQEWPTDDAWDWNAALSESPAAASDDADKHDDDEGDKALAEAMEAERQAEALAMEARRTWSQAQQASQRLKKDRGFGATGCFLCGGNHLAKDCPDRMHPSFQKGSGRKGYGKNLSPAERVLPHGQVKGKRLQGKIQRWHDGLVK